MAKLNDGIANIKEGSNLDILYNRLLAGFLSAQEETLPDYTSTEYVIQTVDEDGALVYTADEGKINASIAEYKQIMMKNSAYLLASSMVGTDSGTGGGGSEDGSGGLFVALTGDYMTGKLSTLYGFASGDDGVKILEVYRTQEENVEDRKNIVSINGELHLDSYGLYINKANVMSYDNDNLLLSAPSITLDGKVVGLDTITVGDVVISQDGIKNGDFIFYHSGNANKKDVDWAMFNGNIYGDLTVYGASEFNDEITALYGFELGGNGRTILSLDSDLNVGVATGLDIYNGIKLRGLDVLTFKNDEVISLSAPGMILNLGDNDTKKMNLQTGIYDDDGEYELVGKFGDAYFPNSFKAGHLLGNVLIETYKNDTEDAGVMVSRWLKFHDILGPGLFSDGDKLEMKAPFRYVDLENNVQITENRYVDMQFIESTSLFVPLNRKSASLFFNTNADFYVFDKPVEGKISLGIAESKTRISDKQLFFDDSVYWQGLSDGVKYYGNAYMVNDIGSVQFSSGFAGSGWQIYKNLLTGNISATFDELTIRKKMRIYELEVQKQSVTNGSLWVSDACSGDIVEEIA